MLKHLLSIVAFMVVSFGVQGLSHFVLNKTYYQSIDHLRADPIIPLGILAMVIQGGVMSMVLQAWKSNDATLINGLVLSLVFGLFLTSYIALVEPAKYTVPSVVGWFTQEFSMSTLQFVIFGLLLGSIHQRFS